MLALIRVNAKTRLPQVSAGEDHACALSAAGEVACWGKCGAGACDPPGGRKFAAVAAGGAHTCAIPRDRAGVLCWGVVPGRAPGGPALLPADVGGAGGPSTVEVSAAGAGAGLGGGVAASRGKAEL